MNIKSLNLTNFKLFKSEDFTFDKINIIHGENYSGKSTVLKAIIFGLYGEAQGTKLDRLISFDEKQTNVKLQLEDLHITRSVPNNLEILYKNEEIQYNTNTLKQDWLNERYNNYEFFKKYHLINKNSINLLDYAKDSRSIVSLRKELMGFIDTDFSNIRQSLLDKKSHRETYSKEKKSYTFYLSKPKLEKLKIGLENIKSINKQLEVDIIDQQQTINNLDSTLNSLTSELQFYLNEKKTKEERKSVLEKDIDKINNEILEFSNKTAPKQIEIIDYDKMIENIQKKIIRLEKDLEDNKQKEVSSQAEIENVNTNITTYQIKSKQYTKEIKLINDDIEKIKKLKDGVRCDKCYSNITAKNRETHLIEKKNILKTKREEHLVLIANIEQQKKILMKLITIKQNFEKEIYNINNILKNGRKTLNELNNKNLEQLKILQQNQEYESIRKSKLDNYKSKLKGFISLQDTLKNEVKDIDKNIHKIKEKVKHINLELPNEKECLNSYNIQLVYLQRKIQKTELYISKLTEAFKFIDYKYTKQDIELINTSIKTLDSFSGWYIQQWLDSLTYIINDFLKEINLSVIFSSDKQFLTINENGRELDYNDLSGGQQVFLSVIFKLAILLQNNISNGVIILDEGLGELKENNLRKLIGILKSTNFQFFLIYQNVPMDLEGVKYIHVIRKENESKRNN